MWAASGRGKRSVAGRSTRSLAVMTPRTATICAVVAIVAELLIGAYATLFAYLGSAWFTDDSWAMRATETDWLWTGVVRFAICLVVAVIGGVATWQINRWLVARGARISSYVPRISGGIVAASIVIASAIGSVQFVVQKPWL